MRFRDWLIALSGLAAIAVAIFALGGVARWSQAIVALLVAVSLGAAFVSRRGLSRVSPLMALLGTAAALCALQLVPLGGLLDIVSPTSSALREDGMALVGVDASSTITSDIPATLAALAFFVTLLGIAHIALRLATSEKGRYRLLVAVAALCGLTAITVWIHKLLGLRALYGLYEPLYAQPGMLGPILNSNSLACLMAVGAVLAIALAAYPRQPGWLRVIWVVVVAACGAITVATVSRGATLAFAAGGLMTVAVIVGQRIVGTDSSKRRRARFMTNALPIGVVAGCMVILVIWSYSGNVGRQLARLSVDEFSDARSKFVVWRSATALVEEAPVLGIGRGAFESAITRVHPASGFATYSHLENEYLQAVVDWGVLGALALALAAIWLAVVAVKRWRDGPLAAGALGAVTIVALQSNVDFGIEFLGLAAPITVIAATLAYVPLREISRLQLVRAARGAHVLALVAAAALLLSSTTTTLDEDRRAIREQQTFEQTFAAIRASIERHPLDYFGYAKAAELLSRGNDPRAIRLLNHAMLLHPTHPDLHHRAAHMLYREGFVAQSTIEYAAALRATAQPRKLLAEIVDRYPIEQAATAIPVDYSEPALIVQTLIELGRSDVATLWLSRAIEQRQRATRACEQLAILAERGEVSAARIAGNRCMDHLPDYHARLALARILTSKQAWTEVTKLLADVETWQSRVDDKIDAWLALCDAYSGLARVDDAKRCLRRLDASPDLRTERRAEIVRRLEILRSAAPLPQTEHPEPTQAGSNAPPP